MSEHRSLTERERVVIAAVVDVGHVKGAAAQLGVTDSAVYRRIEVACERCGCVSLYSLVFEHHHELEGVNPPPIADARTA